MANGKAWPNIPSLVLIENVGQVAFSTVLSVAHSSHKDTSATFWLRALSTKALDLSITVDLVVLENSQLCFLPLVLDFLRSSVDLLLPLYNAISK